MTILEDSILAVFYVLSGTVYTITPQIARTVNITGVSGYREHSFEHPFLLMALEFLAQALCLGLWYIITGGVTPPRNPNGYGGGARNAQNGYGRINYAQPDDAEEDDDDDDDDNMMNIGAGQIQDGPGGDDEPLLQVDDAHGDNRAPARRQRPEIIPNNPAWNQEPVDQTRFNMFLFLVPAFFDISRYGLLYIAIKLAYNSSYMLSRSAAVLFTVLLRVAFLSKHMAKYMWVSSGAVVVGIGLIGMTDFVYKHPTGYDKYGLAAGCLLMVMAQIMIAMQIVYEEKFMDKHNIHPLRIIGLEGCFASVLAVVLLLPFSFIKAGPFSTLKQGHLVDIADAFMQMKGSWVLALCFVGRIVSKTVNYYTGLRFVKNQTDSAKRITIDVHHDLIIWSISLLVHWQNYFYPQIFGYILVPIGMLVYCDIIPLPKIFLPPPVPPPAQGPLQEHEQLMLAEHEQRMRNANDGAADHAQPQPQPQPEAA